MAKTWRPSDVRPPAAKPEAPPPVVVRVALEPPLYDWLQSIATTTNRRVAAVVASMLREIHNDDEGAE